MNYQTKPTNSLTYIVLVKIKDYYFSGSGSFDFLYNL